MLVATRYALAIGRGARAGDLCPIAPTGFRRCIWCNRYRYQAQRADGLDELCLDAATTYLINGRRRAADPARQQRLKLRFGTVDRFLQTLAPIPRRYMRNGQLSAAADAYIDALFAAIVGSAGADLCLSVGDKASDKRWFD